MKKQTMVLSILVGALVILIAGYFIITKTAQKYEEKKEAEAEEESLANIIYVNSLSNVASIEWNGLKFAVDEDAGVFSYADDESFPLDETKVRYVYQEFKNLTADRKFSDGDTLENYGLSEPAYEVILTDADGQTETIKVGNATNDAYYVMVNDDDSVIYRCSLSTLTYISDSLFSYAAIEYLGSTWYNTYQWVRVEQGAETLFVEKVEETNEDAEDEENGTTVTYDISRNGEASYQATSETEVSALISALNFTFSACIDYNVTAEDEAYSTYYLDEPACTITIGYLDEDSEEQELVIYIGGSSDSLSFTAASSQSDQIYTISAEAYTAILTAVNADFLEEVTEEDAAE